VRVDQNPATGNVGLQSPTSIPTPIAGLALWLCPLAPAAPALAALAATLSEAERSRTERRYVAGRATLRALLASRLDTAPATVPLRRGPRGRPELDLPERLLDFNVSHTRDVALIAILEGAATMRIGVDIEHLERNVGADRLARRYLTARERAGFAALAPDARRRRFIRLWTCKEAISKATGDGLRAPMGKVDIDLAAGPRLVAGPDPYDPPAWQLHSMDLPGAYVGTAALWSRAAG
jgi:4'-phosphopantetheinyl transferase